jgi:hypothetical protein
MRRFEKTEDSPCQGFLAAERFSSDDEVKTAVQHWVKTLAADFFDEGIQKLVLRYDECLNKGGDYVEK